MVSPVENRPFPGAGGPADEAAARRILLIDTDPGVCWAVAKGLTRSGYAVTTANSLGDALRLTESQPPDGIIFEVLPEAGLSLEALSMLAERAGAETRVVCVSVESAPHLVIDCMRRGAAHFLPKPFSIAELRNCLSAVFAPGGHALHRRRPAPGETNGGGMSRLIGISPLIQELRVTIEQIAKTDLNCLIRGESGTGKNVVAREIHRLSSRREKPFVVVNCTALPEQLLESELFGYEKGAFTGANTSKPGRFELANNGVIFLDEIGDMAPNLQAKLLQVIEHKEFTKLGGTKHIHVDVQIIAATNSDLEQKTKEGSFRDDLYFRLNEVSVWLPPLAARKEDIPLLLHHFIQKHGRADDPPGIEISSDDLAYMIHRDWPGNVRELESAVKRWLALGRPSFQSVASNQPLSAAPHAPQAPPMPPRLAAPEKPEDEYILEVLNQCHWNRRKAADILGMSYQTLRRRIEKYGLDQSAS